MGRGLQEGEKKAEDEAKVELMRNHGLFSKAEQALKIAGWGEQALRDIEIFRLVEVEGLTPILMVLNEDGDPDRSAAGSSPAPA